MADYIFDFTLTGNKYYNGKVLQVSSTDGFDKNHNYFFLSVIFDISLQQQYTHAIGFSNKTQRPRVCLLLLYNYFKLKTLIFLGVCGIDRFILYELCLIKRLFQ
jgi:hypothetical protein